MASLYAEQKLELRGETGHACVGCCHYDRTGVLLYSCEQERGRQTGGEEKAEGRDEEDINGEPHQQLSSRAPPCGEEQDSAPCLINEKRPSGREEIIFLFARSRPVLAVKYK